MSEGRIKGLGADPAMASLAETLLEIARQTVLRPVPAPTLAALGPGGVTSLEATTSVAVLQEGRLRVVAKVPSRVPFAA